MQLSLDGVDLATAEKVLTLAVGDVSRVPHPEEPNDVAPNYVSKVTRTVDGATCTVDLKDEPDLERLLERYLRARCREFGVEQSCVRLDEASGAISKDDREVEVLDWSLVTPEEWRSMGLPVFGNDRLTRQIEGGWGWQRVEVALDPDLRSQDRYGLVEGWVTDRRGEVTSTTRTQAHGLTTEWTVRWRLRDQSLGVSMASCWSPLVAIESPHSCLIV